MLMWVAICVALTIFYATAYEGHLLWQEQNQIFLATPSWLAGYFAKPAWLGCLTGEWLTQFYDCTLAGAVIQATAATGCSLLFSMAMSRLFSRYLSLTLTLVFTVWMTGCSMSSATRLPFFLCTAGGIGLGMAQFNIRWRHGNFDLSPLLIPFVYWAFGFGAIISAFLIIASALKRSSEKKGYFFSGVTVFFSLAFLFATPAALCKAYALPYAKALVYPGIARPTLPQTGFEERLSIADAFYLRDFDRVKKLSLQASSPDELTAFYYYLASAVQDSLPDNLLKYPVRSLGTLTTIGESTPLPVINMMNDLYFELGDMTYAERAAMMRNVFSPRNRNIRMIRRLAEINLVSGDTLAALKYLRILDRTNSLSQWSKTHLPGKMKPEAEKELMRRRALSNHKDNIRLGDNCRNIILELLESNHTNSVALDYLLCTDLLLKDMDTFKMDYDTYCMAKGSPRYKDLYQQALMIYLAGTDAPQEEWERYIVSDEQMQWFRQYSDRRGDPAFKHTYWYYFDKQ